MQKAHKPIFCLDGKDGKREPLSRLKKALLSEGVEEKCAICGNSDWQSKKIKLRVNFLNRNRLDCEFFNLRLLCMNCTGLQPKTWSRNKAFCQMSYFEQQASSYKRRNLQNRR